MRTPHVGYVEDSYCIQEGLLLYQPRIDAEYEYRLPESSLYRYEGLLFSHLPASLEPLFCILSLLYKLFLHLSHLSHDVCIFSGPRPWWAVAGGSEKVRQMQNMRNKLVFISQKCETLVPRPRTSAKNEKNQNHMHSRRP